MDKLVQGGWSRDSLLSWLFPVRAHAVEEGAGWAPHPSFMLGEMVWRNWCWTYWDTVSHTALNTSHSVDTNRKFGRKEKKG